MAFLWPSCGSLALSVLCTRIRILFILRKNPFYWEKTILIGKPLAIFGEKPTIAYQCHISGVL